MKDRQAPDYLTTHSHRLTHLFGYLLILVFAVSACLPQQQSTDIRVRIIVDGKELTYRASDRISVLQLLQQANIRIDPLDRINPPDFTPITDDMVITIVRVVDKQECTEETVPYKTTALKSPDLPPGQTKVGQPGVNGGPPQFPGRLLESPGDWRPRRMIAASFRMYRIRLTVCLPILNFFGGDGWHITSSRAAAVLLDLTLWKSFYAAMRK